MSAPRDTAPATANLFHAGNTCPFCQESVAEGQLIVTCPECGSIHHELCWSHKGGCASYHCDDSVRNESANLAPDIVISAEESRSVQPPPVQQRKSPDEVARRYLPKKPERLSRMAVASVALAACGVLGLVGIFSRSTSLVALGIALAIGGIVTGVIAMVAINNGKRVHGFGLATTGIAVPSLLIVVFFFSLKAMYHGQAMQFRTDLKLSEDLPSDTQLERLQEPKADALRANVVIKSALGFMGPTVYGSGIITKVEDNLAYILTNKHVIGEAADGQIEVLFYNGERSMADVAWKAPGDVDLAFVSCRALTLDRYSPVRLADLLVPQGTAVFAVGNPMGLSWSYTEGIISSVRSTNATGVAIDIYQTQTPINTGNSGGGLYGLDGALIGINTWTQDKSVAEGLNFATSSTNVLRLLSEAQKQRFLSGVDGAGDDDAEPLDDEDEEQP
jgi:S1-C subfamily serine protease